MFSPCQHHPPCPMFRPDRQASLAIALTVDGPLRSYSGLTFTQPRNATQQVLNYVHLLLFSIAFTLPFVAAKPKWFTAIWETMRSKDVTIRCGDQSWQAHSHILSFELGRFLQALRASTRETCHCGGHNMVITPDERARGLSVRELHSTYREQTDNNQLSLSLQRVSRFLPFPCFCACSIFRLALWRICLNSSLFVLILLTKRGKRTIS
jgi:hypothetical protein